MKDKGLTLLVSFIVAILIAFMYAGILMFMERNSCCSL